MNNKITVIGAGNVGASLAECIAREGIADVVITDTAEGLPQGKALDISQACPLWGSSSSVTGTNGYAETGGSDIVVITAGLARKPGMSRDDLLLANAKIVSTCARDAVKASPDAVFINVTNPMDAMAQVVLDSTGLEPMKVIGMGGVLDSARMRIFVAQEAGVSVRDVEAMVMGGHGDQMVPLPRFTTVKNVPITGIFAPERVEAIIERTRNGGAEIVGHLKTGSAYYAPAAAAYEMVRSVLLDEKRVLPCSVHMQGQYGINGVYAGVPAVLGAGGVEEIIEIELTVEERKLLEDSARSVMELMDKLPRD
jgi:malate dehydrogenase